MVTRFGKSILVVALLGLALPASAIEEKSPVNDSAEPGSPVVTQKAGNWGMTFNFGGLAPLTLISANNFTVNRLFFSEIGMRYVFPKGIILPFSFGVGLFNDAPQGGSNSTDFGISTSVGVLKTFRVWHRIVPFFGAYLHMHDVRPSGTDTNVFNIAIGPTLGIEFFVFDRVSLSVDGRFLIGGNIADHDSQFSMATTISAGGQMALTFYF